ncbi:hypothetical protein ACFLX8_04530 [Chloroflexota bacterium]
MMVQLKLYCSSEHVPVQAEGFSEVIYLLWILGRKGISNEIIDTSCITREEIKEVYSEAFCASISKKLAIRKIFGSKNRSGFRFGREIPALLVYEESGQHPVDVYPHGKKRKDSTYHDTININEYLRALLGSQLEGTVWTDWLYGTSLAVRLGNIPFELEE